MRRGGPSRRGMSLAIPGSILGVQVMKKLTVLLSALALAAPLLADEARVRSPTPLVVGAVSHVLLPTSAFANGRFGAVFKTRISIANVTSSAYDIRVGFSTGAGEAVVRSLAILPYETRTFDNLLSDVLQTSGAGAIDFDSGNAAYRFIVAGQVYVDGPNGRFSTAVQAAAAIRRIHRSSRRGAGREDLLRKARDDRGDDTTRTASPA